MPSKNGADPSPELEKRIAGIESIAQNIVAQCLGRNYCRDHHLKAGQCNQPSCPQSAAGDQARTSLLKLRRALAAQRAKRLGLFGPA